MSEPILRLAMWSGPRNISSAMMRAWGSRADTFVCDEPLYPHYLLATGIDHPGRDTIIACYQTDWRRVVTWLSGPIPGKHRIFFQKHMAHHLLPEIDRSWMAAVTNAFLIRDPAEMLASLSQVRAEPTLAETGLPQQLEIFQKVADALGDAPPLLDARDVLEDPEGMLRALCAAVRVDFDPAMLHWEPGRRETDGIWGEYWYGAVEKSTGFQPYRPPQVALPARLQPLLEECRALYAQLYEYRLRALRPSATGS